MLLILHFPCHGGHRAKFLPEEFLHTQSVSGTGVSRNKVQPQTLYPEKYPLETVMCRSAAMLFVVFLTGCQSAEERWDESSPFYLPPPDSKLILHLEITIPADALKIYLQDGRLVYAANEYYPFCKFELRDLKETPQVVKPDEFEIYRTSRQTGVFARIDKHRLIAGVGIITHFGAIDINDGKPSPIIYGVQMELRSARQPEVFRLTCGHLQDPNMEARYLSIEQMRAALGTVFTLRLAQ